MDVFVKQALKTRAVFMLSFVVIAMMAVLVTHAGAMDLSAVQIWSDPNCHKWCSGAGGCEWICT